MKFRAGGLEFNATVAEASEAPSPQTGEPLRTLTIQFRAQKATMHEQALEEARQRQSGGLFSLDETDQQDLEWRVRESSSSFIGTEPWGINHHVWRIEQVQRVVCERLFIGALELQPDEYAEEVSDTGGVRLVARASISESDLEALSRFPAAVDVIRVGISDTPRLMRLAYLWGERLASPAVVVGCADAAGPRLTLEHATFVEDGFSDLINILSAKGILQDADLDELRRRRHAARHVADIDAWPLTASK